MPSSVSGKVAFVTGGASGIGAALSTELSNGGAEVWIADRQTGRAQELAQHLRDGGAKAHAIELDVRDACAFEGAVANAVHKSGRLDYLFNNAGIGASGEIDPIMTKSHFCSESTSSRLQKSDFVVFRSAPRRFTAKLDRCKVWPHGQHPG